MNDWITAKGPAVVAFAGALGALVHALVPSVAETTGTEAGIVALCIGLAASALHAYQKGATSK